MSYNQEMKKAIHAYMKSVGFKYYTKLYSFVKTIDEDLEISIINEHSYDGVEYQITPSLHLISKSFNELLKDLTEGHYDDNASKGSMFYKKYYSDESRREGGFVYSMKFTSKRSMEENMADYKHVIEDELLVWAEKYSNQEVLYRDILSGKYNGGKGWDNDNYYSPLICYVQKDYAKALEYLDFFLKQKEEKCQQHGNPYGLVVRLDIYRKFHNNLKALIESQPDYKPEGGMAKLAKNIKKLFS